MTQVETAPSLIDAGMAIGRLDERLASPPAFQLAREWFVRNEAIRIAAREKLATDEIRYVSYAARLAQDIPDQSLRSATDIGTALGMVLSWSIRLPSEGEIRDVWDAANASNVTRITPERQWQLDNAFKETAERIDVMLANPSFEKTAKIFLDIWQDPAFGRHGQRMALLLAPFLIRVGLRAPHALVGLAKYVLHPLDQNDVDRERSIDDLLEDFAASIRAGADDTRTASLKLARLEKELTQLAAPERAGSSIEPAVRSLLQTPIATPATLASAINISLRGADHVLDRLLSAGVVAHLGADTRRRAYICHKAINL